MPLTRCSNDTRVVCRTVTWRWRINVELIVQHVSTPTVWQTTTYNTSHYSRLSQVEIQRQNFAERIEESWPVLKTLWPLDYNTRTVSLCSASLGCRLVRFYTMFYTIQVWGFWHKRPLKGKFGKSLSKIFEGTCMMYPRVVAKFGESALLGTWHNRTWYTGQKNWLRRNRANPQFCPQLSDSAQTFLNVVASSPMHVYQIWSGLVAVSRS